MNRVFVVLAAVGVLAAGGLDGPRLAGAKGKEAAAKKPAAATSGGGKAVNACGCYTDSTGACFCGKKGKCACPGECEPKGCDDKRAKQMQKEIAAETKKAADADKRARQDETRRKADKPAPKPAAAR